MYSYVQKLIDGPLDIIGDIHGEVDALLYLLDKLGYDANGSHMEGRKLVFVGDLVDRGPNSVAVINIVKNMMVRGNAQCILGNHELNILMNLCREGNGWFFGDLHAEDNEFFNSVNATYEEKIEIIEFFRSLPLVLESENLRVVHACWDKEVIEQLRTETRNIEMLFNYYEDVTNHYLIYTGIMYKYELEQIKYKAALKDKTCNVPFLEYTAKHDIAAKMFNHIKTVTSGPEKVIDTPYFAGGKWRMLDRDKWWESYDDDIPVVIGHYWRSVDDNATGIFEGIKHNQWFGKKQNVFCIDYSVGHRYIDRLDNRSYTTHLAALRLPENILVTETHTQIIE